MKITKDTHIYILGASGFVGRNVHAQLIKEGYIWIDVPNRNEVDLLNYKELKDYFSYEDVDFVVINCAGRVGGIQDNIDNMSEFMMENILINHNIQKAVKESPAPRKFLLNFGSSCMYPKNRQFPISESSLLSGKLEPTNEGYALAKIVSLKMGQYNNRENTGFRTLTLIPPNLYGPGNCYDENKSHAVAALVKRIFEASITNQKEVKIWGSGEQRREWLYIDDLVSYTIYFLNNGYNLSNKYDYINVGPGVDYTMMQIAQIIKETVGFTGKIIPDTSKPEGMKRKLMNVSRLNSLHQYHTCLNIRDGLKNTCLDYFKYRERE